MEEVDKIILESLRNIDCDIGDVTSIKEVIDSGMSVLVVSSCLETILQDIKLPKKLPPSMSSRMKIASDLSNHIKNLGFNDDMGYSTILYGSELEIRKILMFLIERLPRDPSRTTTELHTGNVPRLIREIDQNVQLYLNHMWIPSKLLHNGIREYDDSMYTVNTYGNSSPLISHTLVNAWQNSDKEDLKDYINHVIPDVTKQSSIKQLIPSIIFKDCWFPDNFNLMENIEHSDVNREHDFNISKDLKLNNTILNKENAEIDKQSEDQNTAIKELSSELMDRQEKYISLNKVVQELELKLSEAESTKHEDQQILTDVLSKVKVKTKTLAVMNKEENVIKLQALIQHAKDQYSELTLQWNQVRTPLLEEYESLKNISSLKEKQYMAEHNKLVTLRETCRKLNKDLKEKKLLEDALTQKPIPRANKRSAYTRRIYEIIGNINKQNNEIQKILKDTRALQKEIKILTEQIDRSFTLADELIFRDAKHEEAARKGYKLLAALRDEFNIILKAISDMGQIERECRNLQDQIEIEISKEIGVKLERVSADLLQLQKETQSLMKYSHG